MFVLKGSVIIGEYIFSSFHDVEIKKSVENIADTAVIKLPRKFIIKQNGTEKFAETAIKVNDPVTIKLGYADRYEGVEFKGFVTKIGIKTPIEIHCEDLIFLLRKKSITRNFGKTNLKEILTEIVKDIKPEIVLAENIPHIPFDTFIVKNKNGAQVLQQLKENHFINSFVDDNNKLYAGLLELTNIGETVIYNLNYNIVSNDLEKIDNEGTSYLVKYTYINPKTNQKTTIEVGDKTGEVKEYHTSQISDLATLKQIAEKALLQLKKGGFSGSVTSFLIPYATRGMKATVIDEEHPELSGNYFIKTVTTSFGLGGARRKVEIGNRL